MTFDNRIRGESDLMEMIANFERPDAASSKLQRLDFANGISSIIFIFLFSGNLLFFLFIQFKANNCKFATRHTANTNFLWQDSNPGQQFKHFSSAPFNLFDWSWASKRAKLFEGAYWKENMLSKRLARRKQLFDKAPIASDRKHVHFFNINVIEQKALTMNSCWS